LMYSHVLARAAGFLPALGSVVSLVRRNQPILCSNPAAGEYLIFTVFSLRCDS
jgi:hypothetical protein